MFMALELITTTGDKQLFGSLFGKGSIAMICAIVGVAVIAAVIAAVVVKCKKNRNKSDKEDK